MGMGIFLSGSGNPVQNLSNYPSSSILSGITNGHERQLVCLAQVEAAGNISAGMYCGDGNFVFV